MSDNFEIKIDLLLTIYDHVVPINDKLNLLLEDFYCKRILLSELEKSALLEYCSCACSLKVLFENYFAKADRLNQEKIVLSKTEYMTIMSMSKTLEISTRTSFANTGIWEH